MLRTLRRFFFARVGARKNDSPEVLNYIDAGLRVTAAIRALEKARGQFYPSIHGFGDGLISYTHYFCTPECLKDVHAKKLILCNEIKTFIDNYGHVPRRELSMDMFSHCAKILREAESGFYFLELHWSGLALTYINAYRSGRIYEEPLRVYSSQCLGDRACRYNALRPPLHVLSFGLLMSTD
ncbi:unnamed protein product, partial [Mesorhabditis spiculigera]